MNAPMTAFRAYCDLFPLLLIFAAVLTLADFLSSGMTVIVTIMIFHILVVYLLHAVILGASTVTWIRLLIISGPDISFFLKILGIAFAPLIITYVAVSSITAGMSSDVQAALIVGAALAVVWGSLIFFGQHIPDHVLRDINGGTTEPAKPLRNGRGYVAIYLLVWTMIFYVPSYAVGLYIFETGNIMIDAAIVTG